jgi:hypothetical protein
MKLGAVIIVASLAANLGLGYMAWKRAQLHPAAADAAGTPEPAPAPAIAFPGPARAGDLKADELERRGFSPEVSRAIVRASIARQFAQRRAEIRYPDGVPFWKQGFPPDKDQQAALAAVDAEHTGLLQSVLGPGESLEAEEVRRAREWKYAGIPRERIKDVDAVEEEMRLRERSIFNLGSTISADERYRLSRQLTIDREARLAALLTPEQYEAYDLRNARHASRMISGVRELDLTEAEYLSLYRNNVALEETFRNVGAEPATRTLGMREARQLAYEHAQKLLDPERLHQYQKGTDPDYAEIARAVPEARTVEVWNLMRAATNETAIASAKGPLGPAEFAAINARIEDSKAKLRSLLGPEAAEKYFQTRHGKMWLTPRAP